MARWLQDAGLNDAISRLVGTLGGISMMRDRLIHGLHHSALHARARPSVQLKKPRQRPLTDGPPVAASDH